MSGAAVGLLGQRVVVLLLVAGALAYLARRAWRTLRHPSPAADGPPCGASCGCSPEVAD